MNPLIVALDVEPGQADKTIQRLKAGIEIFKIGSRLFTALGPEIINSLHKARRKVFLDLKFHDIPKTVAESCRNAVRMKVWALTIHTSGGYKMMREAARVVKEESERLHVPKPLIFGVTVLTSLADKDLRELGISNSVNDQVKRLAHLAKKAGLDGVVASGNEIKTVRKACGEKFLIAVPGIRLSRNKKGDQKRVMTPKLAVQSGANYIVVGRPILEAKDPCRAAEEIIQDKK